VENALLAQLNGIVLVDDEDRLVRMHLDSQPANSSVLAHSRVALSEVPPVDWQWLRNDLPAMPQCESHLLATIRLFRPKCALSPSLSASDAFGRP